MMWRLITGQWVALSGEAAVVPDLPTSSWRLLQVTQKDGEQPALVQWSPFCKDELRTITQQNKDGVTAAARQQGALSLILQYIFFYI